MESRLGRTSQPECRAGYLPDSDSETEYRVTEAVAGSYVQVGDTKKENKTDVDGTYPEFQFTNKAVTSLTVEKKWHTADTKKHPITMELWRTTDKNLMGKTGVDGVEQVAGHDRRAVCGQ